MDRLNQTLAAILIGMAAMCVGSPRACNAQVIYTFASPATGQLPEAPVIMDKGGVLYGTTAEGGPANAGTVYTLSPPAPGKAGWTLTTIYTFLGGGDGSFPLNALTIDSSGALYGVTANFQTTTFKLTPPSAGQSTWTKTVIYSGNSPSSALLPGPDGSFYGTTVAANLGGTVYQLKPPTAGSSTWTETTLYQFTDNAHGGYPNGPLIMDGSGSLYGTAGGGGVFNSFCPSGCGIVYRLSPPKSGQGSWSIEVLYKFKGGTDGYYPVDGVIFGQGARLFGTTFYGGDAPKADGGDGTVFELTPPSDGISRWTETVIQRFAGSPHDGSFPNSIVFGAGGSLFGTTEEGGLTTPQICRSNTGCGSFFEISPPAAGSTRWKRTGLKLAGQLTGVFPVGVLLGTDGAFYATTSELGPAVGAEGTVIRFEGQGK
jgi:uncharacterized repeat protein (TIGR03803 family)